MKAQYAVSNNLPADAPAVCECGHETMRATLNVDALYCWMSCAFRLTADKDDNASHLCFYNVRVNSRKSKEVVGAYVRIVLAQDLWISWGSPN